MVNYPKTTWKKGMSTYQLIVYSGRVADKILGLKGFEDMISQYFYLGTSSSIIRIFVND